MAVLLYPAVSCRGLSGQEATPFEGHGAVGAGCLISPALRGSPGAIGGSEQLLWGWGPSTVFETLRPMSSDGKFLGFPLA